MKILDFNSHAHVERDGFFSALAVYAVDFNSHAHVERDCENKHLAVKVYISTHTLTWSVTIE